MQSSKIFFVASLGLGFALAAGCSSSSSSTTPSDGGPGDDGSSGSSSSSSSSSSGGDGGGIVLGCMGGDCTGAKPACCATVMLGGAAGISVTSACAASCTIGMLTPQFCVTSAECPSGYHCAPNALGMGPNDCTPGAAEGGASSSGGDGGSSSSSGGDGGGEGGSSSGGDAASDVATGG